MAVAWRKICEYGREYAAKEVDDGPSDLRVDLQVNLWMFAGGFVVA